MKVVFAALASIMLAAPAVAVAEPTTVRSTTVLIPADAFATEQGVRATKAALEEAARSVCSSPADTTLADRREREQCVRKAYSKALEESGLTRADANSSKTSPAGA